MSRTSTLSACPGTQGGVLGPSESDLGVGHQCQNLRIDLTVAVADRQEVTGAVSRACRGVPAALHALLFLWGAADGPRVTRRCRPTDQRGRAANPWGSAALGPPPDHACDASLPGAGRPGPAVDRASPRGTRPPVGATLPGSPPAPARPGSRRRWHEPSIRIRAELGDPAVVGAGVCVRQRRVLHLGLPEQANRRREQRLVQVDALIVLTTASTATTASCRGRRTSSIRG